jgi:chemotaxis protein CheD
MCHIILPGRNKRDEMHTLDARYADEAMQIFYREVIRAGTLPQQYQTYVVGGGNMYLTESVKFSVGARNVEAARIHLKKFGFIVRSEHTGSSHHRKVELDLVLGLVTVTCNFKRFDLAIPKR